MCRQLMVCLLNTSDDRTLVPVRFIAESLGMDVGYNDSTRTVTLSGNGYKVNMTLDKSEYTINDIPFEMDVPAQVVNDRMLIPLRAVSYTHLRY